VPCAGPPSAAVNLELDDRFKCPGCGKAVAYPWAGLAADLRCFTIRRVVTSIACVERDAVMVIHPTAVALGGC
jgi:hypothetical protein